MVQFKFALYIILLLALTGCRSNAEVNSSAYRASFDSLNDTVGWIGISPMMFVKAEGKDFVAFKNTSSRPAASLEFNIPEEGHYKLLCTGKSNINGGYICLRNLYSNTEARCMYINSHDWKEYSSSKIYCPCNSRIFIEVFAGGDFASDLYIDEISLARLD